MWITKNFFNDPFRITLILKFLPTVSWLIHLHFAGGNMHKVFAFSWMAGEDAFGEVPITSIKDECSSSVRPLMFVTWILELFSRNTFPHLHCNTVQLQRMQCKLVTLAFAASNLWSSIWGEEGEWYRKEEKS